MSELIKQSGSEFIDLEEIIYESFDNIMITNSEGRILLCSRMMLYNLGIDEELMRTKTVKELVDEHRYSRSTALEVLETHEEASGIILVPEINGRAPKKIYSTSKPIFDENGDMKYVITNSREEDTMISYFEELQKEKENVEKYKNIVDYLTNERKDISEVIFKSSEMSRIINLCDVISKTDSTILITGETGVGKDVISKYIYKKSNRKDKPFIPVNCGSIPPNLIESELFGYVKGAFTGANSSGATGFFELANHGTIFLDEIGELPLNLQAKLLRVIENNEIKKIGDTAYKKVDVRIIAATNRDLGKMVEEKKFREDLYYRLNVIPIIIPPLRERREDIEPLIIHFLNYYNQRYKKNKTLSTMTMNGFLKYYWPGNVREIRNLMQRLVLISTEDVIDYTISPGIKEVESKKDIDHSIEDISYFKEVDLKEAVKAFEKKYIKEAIDSCGGNITKAAELLGIHRTHLYKKIKK